ncbi:hypothetical protein H8958_007457 [Nasalis larvatus]
MYFTQILPPFPLLLPPPLMEDKWTSPRGDEAFHSLEVEQIGQEMLENLSHDREKIQRARERLRETDANLGKSSRILTGMLRRACCLDHAAVLSPQMLCGHRCNLFLSSAECGIIRFLAENRIIQNRILLVILGIVVVITILMAITFSVRRH